MSHDDFPQRVRAERKKRGWSQQELADRANVSVRTVQMFEGGKSTGTPANRRAVLDALGIANNNGTAAETRAGWPEPVKIFLDMLGAYLMTFPEERRLDVMHDLTRQIFESHE